VWEQGADAVKKMFEQDDTVEGTWMKVRCAAAACRLPPSCFAPLACSLAQASEQSEPHPLACSPAIRRAGGCSRPCPPVRDGSKARVLIVEPLAPP
jgi:hypothetical protein